jgi:hypothetical protein
VLVGQVDREFLGNESLKLTLSKLGAPYISAQG